MGEQTKFELGPIQKEWVQSLKDHPERQMMAQLGKGNINNYKACCLGELLICYNRAKEIFIEFDSELNLIDRPKGSNKLLYTSAFPSYSYESLGLYSANGDFKATSLDFLEYKFKEFTSLASANDHGVPWPVIAEFVEQYPEKIFKISV